MLKILSIHHFAVMKEVVERKYHLEDVAELQRLQRKYNTVNACGKDSCFFMNVEGVKEVDQYGDEEEKRKHFSFHLDGGYHNGRRLILHLVLEIMV